MAKWSLWNPNWGYQLGSQQLSSLFVQKPGPNPALPGATRTGSNTNLVGCLALVLLTQGQSLSPLLDELAVHQGDLAHVLQDREETSRSEPGNTGTTVGSGNPITVGSGSFKETCPQEEEEETPGAGAQLYKPPGDSP